MRFATLAFLLAMSAAGNVGRTQDKDNEKRGDPIHRQRTKDYVAALRRMDLDGMVGNLINREHYDYPGVDSWQKFPQNNLENVLSNRGMSCIWAKLEMMPAEAAAKQAKAIFARTFREQQETVDRVLCSYEDPKAPKNKQSMEGNHRGLCAAIFLTSRYCPASEVVRELKLLREFAATVDQRMAKKAVYPEILKGIILDYLHPDNAFQLNVLTYAILHNDAKNPETRKKLTKILADLPSTKVKLTPWDAEVGTYDFIRVHEGVPIDAASLFQKVILYEWPKKLRTNKEYQNHTLQSLATLAAP